MAVVHRVYCTRLGVSSIQKVKVPVFNPFVFLGFLLSVDFFQNYNFQKILSGILSVSNSLEPGQV